MELTPALRQLKEATLGTQFEGGLWIVGGAVRDSLLGRPSGDVDIVSEQPLDELEAALLARGMTPEGVARYPRFGTALVVILGEKIEFATARSESYDEMSRKPDVRPASLEDDSLRRDFTANALMINLHSGEMADPTGRGLADLKSGILRTPRDPDQTFFDDPLRMLRAVRFRWQLGFRYAEGLQESIHRNAHRLDVISGERIQEELVKMLRRDTAADALQDLIDLGLLGQFAPEIAAMAEVTQEPRFHHLDVWEHSLAVVRGIQGSDWRLRLAALLHDVGKPSTRTVDPDGRIRFFEHETVGAQIAGKVLNRLRFSQRDIRAVEALVAHHMRLIGDRPLSDSAVRRLAKTIEENLDDLLLLCEADALAHRPGLPHRDWSVLRAQIERVLAATPVEALRSPLTGQQIAGVTGLSEGPEIGVLKAKLADLVIEGHLVPDDLTGAEAWLRENWRNVTSGQGVSSATCAEDDSDLESH